MSAPVSSSANNGFTLSADGSSAKKEFTVNGVKLQIKIHFPSNSKAEKDKILNDCTDARLQLIGQYALSIGLGAEGKPNDKAVNAVHFVWDKQGMLVQKHYADNHKKEIKMDHYSKKLAKYSSDSQLVAKIQKQKQFYELIAGQVSGKPSEKKAVPIVDDVD